MGAQSVALVEGDLPVAVIGISGGRGTSDRVLRLVEAALELSGTALPSLDAVVVSCGPGSLTGLRVGIGTARGIATGAGRRLVGVSSLQALAACAGAGPPVLALIDAGRGEVYGGLFQPGDPPSRVGEERVAPPEAFALAVQGREVRAVGSGAVRNEHLFPGAARGEPFLALGAVRVAAACLRSAAAEWQGGDLRAAPRYLRRDPSPVRFED